MNVTGINETSILFPPARIVQGDLYIPQDKDQMGNPLTIKTGANIGQPRVSYFFAIAVPKNPGEQAWWQAAWGQQIYKLAATWWPQLFNAASQWTAQGGQCINPRFAFKIEDGDSTVPNQNGRKNCDSEGFPGHWIIKLGSSFPAKVYTEAGAPMLEKGLVKRGYWVEVLANIASNENAQNPGIYINHSMVSYRAPGAEITSGPDPRAVGFGRAALPAGVTAQPLGNVSNMPAVVAAPALVGMPAPTVTHQAMSPMLGIAPPGAVVAPAPTVIPTAIQPNPSFLQPPVGAVAAPPPPAAVAAAPAAPSVMCPLGAPLGYRMMNLNGPRYESYKAQGWNEQQLVQAGHMVRL